MAESAAIPLSAPMAEAELIENEKIVNSLGQLAEQLNNPFAWEGFPSAGGGGQISGVDTMIENLRWYLISNFRQVLSELYVEHGIVQTLVDQPVDDAFRAGYEIKSEQLDANDIEKIKTYMEKNKVNHNIMQAIKWGRLYGGGAVLIITNQNPEKKLRIESITENDPVEFRGVDMWELYANEQNVSGGLYVGGALGANMGEWYDYYGHAVHESRVLRAIGKEAPSFVRPRLRGWGMSELERLVRSMNQYLKNQDLIFQLLDEAKVDVYRIKGYNSALLNKNGTNAVAQKIQTTNRLKSYNNAITMDKEDEYEQKQITFTGLAEVLLQIRQGIAADLKMPMTKLFGISASGFNSGEDDIENYNSMIEGEIRSKNRFIVIECVQVVCQKLLGFSPDDLMIEWNPLRMLNAKEEEEVKDSQFARVMTGYTSGLVSPLQSMKAINAASLIPIEIDEKSDALPPVMGAESDDGVKPAKGNTGKKTPQED